jgi:hypothetical protein
MVSFNKDLAVNLVVTVADVVVTVDEDAGSDDVVAAAVVAVVVVILFLVEVCSTDRGQELDWIGLDSRSGK